MQMRTGHVMRVVGVDNPDALRGSGLWFFLDDERDDAKPVMLTKIIRPLGSCSGHAMFIGTAKGQALSVSGLSWGHLPPP